MTVQDALRMYFAKIRSPQYFPMYPARYDPDAAKRVLAGQYLVPREKTPDFSAFEREFGIPLPEELRAYYSTWHPYLTGGHPGNPHKRECVVLEDSLHADPCAVLCEDMRSCAEDYPDLRFIPVGGISYVWERVLFERATGKIFVEYSWDADGENMREPAAEDCIWKQPLAKSLAELICTLNPYPYE